MSNEEKQIEEMAKVLCKKSKPCIRCEMQFPCIPRTDDAQLLYDAGYRKASDVAKEIFAEIEQNIGKKLHIDDHMRTYAKDSSVSYKMLAELKKKYESEGGK